MKVTAYLHIKRPFAIIHTLIYVIQNGTCFVHVFLSTIDEKLSELHSN